MNLPVEINGIELQKQWQKRSNANCDFSFQSGDIILEKVNWISRDVNVLKKITDCIYRVFLVLTRVFRGTDADDEKSYHAMIVLDHWIDPNALGKPQGEYIRVADAVSRKNVRIICLRHHGLTNGLGTMRPLEGEQWEVYRGNARYNVDSVMREAAKVVDKWGEESGYLKQVKLPYIGQLLPEKRPKARPVYSIGKAIKSFFGSGRGGKSKEFSERAIKRMYRSMIDHALQMRSTNEQGRLRGFFCTNLVSTAMIQAAGTEFLKNNMLGVGIRSAIQQLCECKKFKGFSFNRKVTRIVNQLYEEDKLNDNLISKHILFQFDPDYMSPPEFGRYLKDQSGKNDLFTKVCVVTGSK